MVLSKNKITKPTRLRLKIRAFVVVLPCYEKNNRKKSLFSFQRLIGVAKLEWAGGVREWAIFRFRKHRYSRFFFLCPVLSSEGKKNCFLFSFHLTMSWLRKIRLPYCTPAYVRALAWQNATITLKGTVTTR